MIDTKCRDVRYGSKADIPVVQAYRADFTREVFYKPTPYRPVLSRIFLRACKTSWRRRTRRGERGI
jgi:hypothetical protein